MSNKKNQHFIPRFYLKRFSRNGDEKSINIFLPIVGRFIQQGGSITGQAARDFYYGKDGAIEDALCTLEGAWSTALKGINKDSFPLIGSQQLNLLLDFICFTDFRNPTRADQIEAVSEVQGSGVKSVYKVMTEENIRESEQFLKAAQTRIKEEKVVESLQHAKRAVAIISDLKIKLLINETPRPFLTSDYPIVLYNQYFEKLSQRHIPFGLGNWGVQIFFPLDSKQTIILYDSDRYLVGNNKRDVVIVKSTKDIDQLNILQFQNSINAVYGSDLFSSEYGHFLTSRASKFSKNRGLKHNTVWTTPKSTNTLIKPHNIRCGLDLSFISLPLSAARNRLNPNMIYVRPAVEHVRRKMDMQDWAAQANLRELLRKMRYSD